MGWIHCLIGIFGFSFVKAKTLSNAYTPICSQQRKSLGSKQLFAAEPRLIIYCASVTKQNDQSLFSFVQNFVF